MAKSAKKDLKKDLKTQRKQEKERIGLKGRINSHNSQANGKGFREDRGHQ